MTRAEITEQFKHVKQGGIVNPQSGECYEMDTMPIRKQLNGLGEGKQKIFFLKVKDRNDDGEMPEINLELVSEEIYISPTKYV